ncbi:MAG: hypothetical protein HKP61_23385 [Dactylosporangium sp.]|nr:hypothetical protein [Dactylosporangium sp.]NNJ63823.1 hypothetical protein [Dactylosporangium sp.]
MTTTSAKPSPAMPGGPRPRAAIAAKTLRTDRWWLPSLLSGGGFGLFVLYTGIRCFFIQESFWVEQYHYLTPVFSPCISEKCPDNASDLGQWLPASLPFFIPLPILTLGILTVFRLTCYYYRKMYYRAYFMSPPGCAVNEPAKKYSGETRFPLIFQNIHRYGWWLACGLLMINTWDAVRAFHGADGDVAGGFGIGLGTLIIWGNLVMLWGYSVSCHACRHITGGRLKHFSRHPVRYWLWTKVSKLNAKHMEFAWASLFSVIITDVYIMSVSAGWITDLRIFN